MGEPPSASNKLLGKSSSVWVALYCRDDPFGVREPSLFTPTPQRLGMKHGLKVLEELSMYFVGILGAHLMDKYRPIDMMKDAQEMMDASGFRMPYVWQLQSRQ